MTRRNPAGTLLPALLLVTAGLVGACASTSGLDSADAGRTISYEPGLPNFDMEALATWRDGETGIDVYLGIPQVSLVFVRQADAYVAGLERIIRLLDRRSRDVVMEVADADTIRVRTYDDTQRYEPLVRTRRVDVAPGEYIVEVSVTDTKSEQRAVRRQAVEVVPVDETRPFISRMRVEGRRGGGDFEPIVSLHLPADTDSLRTIVELFNVETDGHVEVSLRLLQLRTDTSAAAPPYWLSPSRGSVGYRGVVFESADTLQVTRRRILQSSRESVVEFLLPRLDGGIYRLDVRAVVQTAGASDDEVALSQERLLSVKSPTFPTVELLDDLIVALEYIAYEDEIEEIRAAPSVAEKKRRFDAFWGTLVPNRQVAANLLKLYYGRVEEANLFFTNYKEGWRTDRGMIYVVLGPPIYVENRIDSEVWFYSYGDRDPIRTFVFERVRAYQVDDHFEHFILQRRPYYHQEWSRAVEKWRNGTVL